MVTIVMLSLFFFNLSINQSQSQTQLPATVTTRFSHAYLVEDNLSNFNPPAMTLTSNKTSVSMPPSIDENRLPITTSVEPPDFIRYLFDDPYLGIIPVNREACQEQMLPRQVSTEDRESTGFSKVELSIGGKGGTVQSIIPIDVVVAIDSSGSMRVNDPSNLRLSAAKVFLDKLNPVTDRAGVVSWDDNIDFTFPLIGLNEISATGTSVKTSVDNIDSTGGTNLDLGLKNAISLLDLSQRTNPSSKAIIFLTDGEEGKSKETGFYTPSGNIGSLVDDAKTKGYKIYSIGLNIRSGSIEETRLKDMAIGSGGQYYFPPTAENLQAAFDNIYQTVIKSTEPENVDVVAAIQNYVVVDENSFSVPPTSIAKSQDNLTTIKWENIGQYIGNKDRKLSGGEGFNVSFSAGLSTSLNNVTARLPLTVDGKSIVQYTDSLGKKQTVNIPQMYVNVESRTCQAEKKDFRILNDTFIVPGSENGTFGIYEKRTSNVFKPDEEIRLVAEYEGNIQRPSIDNSGYVQYFRNTTGNFTITDIDGKPVKYESTDMAPFDSETTEGKNIKSSYTFWHTPHGPSLTPGEYILNYSITDNISGKKITNTKNFIVEGLNQDLQIINDTFIIPGSYNGTQGIYKEHKSKLFNANESMEFYVELAGFTQNRTVDVNNNTGYASNVYASLILTDLEGNIKAKPPQTKDGHSYNVKFTDRWRPNASYVFGFEPIPTLNTDVYIANITLTDNPSGRAVSFTKDVAIQGKKQDFRFVNDTFIEPGSLNKVDGTYQARSSNEFDPYEDVELVVNYVGLTFKPILTESDTIKFRWNTTSNFTITDSQGKPVELTRSFEPFESEAWDRPSTNGSGWRWFKEYTSGGARPGGNYIMNYIITDNLSGQKISRIKAFSVPNGIPSSAIPETNKTIGQENVSTSKNFSSSIEKPQAISKGTNTSSTSSPAIYTNPELGFRIDYPVGWQKIERLVPPTVLFMPADNAENVSFLISKENVPEFPSLEGYENYRIKLLNQTYLNDQFSLLDSRSASKDGKQAFFVSYSFVSPTTNTKVHAFEVFMISEKNKVFSLIYNADESVFSKYLPTIKHMISSFDIIK
jgi:hypothetical protein